MQLLQNLQSYCLPNVREKLIENIQACQIELNQFYKLKTKGAMVRSRTKWFEKGEKNTKYFLNLEKSGFDQKRISEIKNKQGNIVSDQMGTLGVLQIYLKKFYQNVTSSNAMQIDAYLEEVNLRPLLSNQTESMSGPVTKQECLAALLKMSNDKSPGLGGFSVEFYKCFWNDFNDLLLQSYQFSYDADVLADTQREDIIILIPKRNKDPLLPSSYRPITLLNIDYKIIASVINSRIKCYLNELIRPSQNGFIKGD